jgi:hypothetical protein
MSMLLLCIHTRDFLRSQKLQRTRTQTPVNPCLHLADLVVQVVVVVVRRLDCRCAILRPSAVGVLVGAEWRQTLWASLTMEIRLLDYQSGNFVAADVCVNGVLGSRK